MAQKTNDKLFTMPKPYYGATTESAGSQGFRPPAAGGAAPVVEHKNRSVMIILGIGMLVLLALAGYLVYLNYQPVNLPNAGKVTSNGVQGNTVTGNEVTSNGVAKNTIQTPPTPPVEPIPAVTTPVEEPAPVESTPPAVESPVTITEPQVAKIISDYTTTDADNDGLTDAEELLIGTKVDTADSDGDTYLDGNELVNLYNPLAKDPASIAFSGITSTYVNPVFEYSILYPKSWVAKAVDVSSKEVLFSSAVGENVSVIIHDNPQSLSVLDWYKTQNPTDAEKVSTMTTKSNTLVLRSTDGFHVFAAKGKIVVELVYAVGMKDEISYPHLFEMMVQGLVFTGQE